MRPKRRDGRNCPRQALPQGVSQTSPLSGQFGLPRLLELFQQKFAPAGYSLVHVLKSLTYFAGAEKDPMPDVLAPLSWEEVKRFFANEAPRLL